MATAAPNFGSAIGLGPLDDDFFVHRVLGAGSFGQVYLVDDKQSGERRALKVLSPGANQDPQLKERLHRELLASQRVDSKAVARAFRSGTLSNGRAFVVFELLEGVDLERYAAERGRVPEREAVEYLVFAAYAAHAAHLARIVHRDIKPGNLMRLHRPTEVPVKLLDFGIAHFRDAAAITVNLIGTPPFAGPELLHGQHGTVAGDVFSLGATLYSLLCGRGPWTGDDPHQVLAEMKAGRLVPLEQVAPHVSALVRAVTMRALALDPGARFVTALELAEALLDACPLPKRPTFAATLLEAPKAPFVEAPRSDGESRIAKGGHALIAVDASDGQNLANANRDTAIGLASDAQRARLLAEQVWGERVAVVDAKSASAAWQELAVERARRVVLLSGDDDANLLMARTALEALSEQPTPRAGPEIVVRIEDALRRKAKGDALHTLARARGVELRVVSADVAQLRAGLQRARPSRYRIASVSRVHLAVAGGGPLLPGLLSALARQGYGLEVAPPRITLLGSVLDATVKTLVDALNGSKVAEVSSVALDLTHDGALGRALAELCGGELPVSAIHCLGEKPGDACAVAELVEQGLSHLKLPAPLMVAYDRDGGGADSPDGPMSVVWRDDMLALDKKTQAQDVLARAFHEHHVAQHGGEHLPAAVLWSQLLPSFREDNRNVPDHLGFKLDSVGLSLSTTGGLGELSPKLVERLSDLEHSRWMASKLVAGWRYGPTRTATEHPSLMPYAALSESEKEKDRTQQRLVPKLLAPTHALKVDLPVAVWLEDAPAAWEPLVDALAQKAERLTTERLVVVLALRRHGDVDLALRLHGRGVAYRVVESGSSLSGPAAALARSHALSFVRVLEPSVEALRREVFARARAALTSEGMEVPTLDDVARWSDARGLTEADWLTQG